MRFSPLALLPPVIFAAIAAMFAWGMFREDPDAFPLAIQGQVVPDLALEDVAGAQPFTSETLKQPGVKLVNFWASWCGPCRVEHPALMRLREEGLPIYGINYKDKPEDAAAFLAELGDPYIAQGSDRNGRNGLDWGVVAMPETFVVDGNGVILLRHPGAVTSRIIDEVIRPALADADPEG